MRSDGRSHVSSGRGPRHPESSDPDDTGIMSPAGEAKMSMTCQLEH